MKKSISLSAVTLAQVQEQNLDMLDSALGQMEQKNQKFLLDNAVEITKEIKIDFKARLCQNVFRVSVKQHGLKIHLIGDKKCHI